jgi:hypothetical protein
MLSVSTLMYPLRDQISFIHGGQQLREIGFAWGGDEDALICLDLPE